MFQQSSTNSSSVAMKIIGRKHSDVAYRERSAVHAILKNPLNQQIALIHVVQGNYHKLPGGGVELGEDYSTALVREILEETGCRISLDIGTYYAKSEEWCHDLHQISFCYVTEMVEDTGSPKLTNEEVADGFSHHWVSVEDAIRAMRDIEPTSELEKFTKERDLFIIEKFATLRAQRCFENEVATLAKLLDLRCIQSSEFSPSNRSEKDR